MGKGLQYIVCGLLLTLCIAFDGYVDISFSNDASSQKQTEALEVALETSSTIDLFLEDSEDKTLLTFFIEDIADIRHLFQDIIDTFSCISDKAIILQKKEFLLLDLPPPFIG